MIFTDDIKHWSGYLRFIQRSSHV